MNMRANPNAKTISVLGSHAGIDDELLAWLVDQSKEIDVPVPIIAVAVLRDYMRACKALKIDEARARQRNLN